MRTLYDVQQLLKRFGSYVYLGKRLWDIEMIGIELDSLYQAGMLDLKVYQTAKSVLTREHDLERQRELNHKEEITVNRKLIGIDLGGTTAKFAILTEAGEVQQKWSIETNSAEEGTLIVPDIIASIKHRLEMYNMTKRRLYRHRHGNTRNG